MEARCEGETHNFYGMGAAKMWASGKRNLEWDLNDWKWDGDLFIAKPVDHISSTNMNRQFFPVRAGAPAVGNSSNSSSSCSDEVNLEFERSKRDLEKRRRVVLIEDDNLNEDEAGSLSLKIGGQGYPAGEREAGNWDGNGGKKSKVVGGSSRAVCQVGDCGADLSKAKDYHRRHKVCEMHSKATKALVGNALQRFCQQCSRFHVLQEFDEGKRSCRRRLAGHNKRRRKTNPEATDTVSSESNDQTSSYLLISLLRILSNMHSNKSDPPTDQELLSHHLKSLAGQSVENGGINLSRLLQSPQHLLKGSSSLAKSEQDVLVHEAKAPNLPTNSKKPSIPNNYPLYPEVPDGNNGQSKMNNFDLNDIYIDSDDGTEDVERSPAAANGSSSLDCPSWVQQDSHQSSPPQTSGNSDSASGQSPSSSSGDAQSRTDRIIFKLFGKEPNDFPLVVRAQILDWLAHSPTDIESYIRPGCIILTVYLRQAEADWENLCCDLTSSLSKLLDVSDDPFWRTGWIYIRVQHQVAFVYNGQVVFDKSLPIRSCNSSKILSVKPIAIPASKKAQFLIKGINLSRPSTRLLCAIEGNYLVQESNHDLKDTGGEYNNDEDLQFLNYSCDIPQLSGRGFIEIEDHGFSCSFFPFIVAEEDVCSEICMLECVLDFDETETDLKENVKMEAKIQALDFIHEIGWLLRRSQLKSRVGDLDPNTNLFPLRRLRWLIEFSMDREWRAVVKKLLNILLDGLVGTGECSTLSQALSEMTLLHRAVRKNSRSMVDFLLKYVPEKSESENREEVHGSLMNPIFRPDALGPAGLTPLHIAAGKDGSEDVLDSLTSDPGMVGIEAWKTARDSTGLSPEDYARLRGHYSYFHLVQKKINKRPSTRHVVLDIPGALMNFDTDKKLNQGPVPSFEIGRPTHGPVPNCKLCSQNLVSEMGCRSLAYRPAMLSMVAIAAVCVCVALLFKSYPEVVFIFRPFRWEMLDYGAS